MQFNLNAPFDEFSRVFPTPTNANSNIWLRLCNQWFWHLGHYTRINNLTENSLTAIINHLHHFKAYQGFWKSVNLIDSEIWTSFENCAQQGYHQTRFPNSAPEDIANCINWFENYIGQIDTPLCFKRGKSNYRRLWMAVLLYGLGERTFPFARNRMAKGFASVNIKINAKTIQTFLKLAEKTAFIIKTRKGRSFNPQCQTGNETTFGSDCYKLTTKALSKVPSFLNLRFKKHLMFAAPWIIKEGN